MFFLARPSRAHGGCPKKHPQGVDEKYGTLKIAAKAASLRTKKSPLTINAPNLQVRQCTPPKRRKTGKIGDADAQAKGDSVLKKMNEKPDSIRGKRLLEEKKVKPCGGGLCALFFIVSLPHIKRTVSTNGTSQKR
jgi:hypothetical protein